MAHVPRAAADRRSTTRRPHASPRVAGHSHRTGRSILRDALRRRFVTRLRARRLLARAERQATDRRRWRDAVRIPLGGWIPRHEGGAVVVELRLGRDTRRGARPALGGPRRPKWGFGPHRRARLGNGLPGPHRRGTCGRGRTTRTRRKRGSGRLHSRRDGPKRIRAGLRTEPICTSTQAPIQSTTWMRPDARRTVSTTSAYSHATRWWRNGRGGVMTLARSSVSIRAVTIGASSSERKSWTNATKRVGNDLAGLCWRRLCLVRSGATRRPAVYHGPCQASGCAGGVLAYSCGSSCRARAAPVAPGTGA